MSVSQRLPSHALARRAAGRAVRELGHSLVGHQADEAILREVAATLDGLTRRLGTGVPRSRPVEHFDNWEGDETSGLAPVESYDDRPFSGRASPWGLDIEVHRRGDTIEGVVTLGAAHEGAPGRAHGGIVAGLFDDVFGFVLGVIRQPAFTGELTVRYVKPTPLHRPLLCRGRVVDRSGRKLWIEGELLDTAEPSEFVVARGKGLFVTVDPSVFSRTIELPAPDGER